MNKCIQKILIGVFILITQFLFAQNNLVSGIVKDSADNPLPGATIVVKETKKAVASDFDGHFTIAAKIGQSLRVSFVGMKTSVIKITTTDLKIILEDQQELIDEVVITGYQKINTRAFTGATTSLKLNDVKLDGVADISKMLEGRVAGVTIQSVSGSFGTAPRINIRGGASILGNTQPLWVIDGSVYEDLVPLTPDQLVSGDAVTLIGSAISGLNATDIKDIQVLKDASATSIYGARALNGVIVITTKSGLRDSPNKITYAYEQSFRNIPRYADFDVLNSQQTMAVNHEMEQKGYFNLKNTLYGRRSGIYYQWYKGVSTINPLTGNYYYENTAAAKQKFFKEREYANANWFNTLFTINPITSHTLTFSGGGKNTAGYASLGFYNDKGWTIADNVQRITTNLKNTFYVNDKLKTTFSLLGNMRKQKAPGTFTQRKNTITGTFQRDFDINPFAYALSTPRTLRARNNDGALEYYRNNWAPFNIINEYENNYISIDVLDFKAQAQASFQINEDLKIQALFSARQAHTSTSHYITDKSNVIGAFRANETPYVANQNIYLLKNIENPFLNPKIAFTHGGIFNKTETKLNSYVSRLALDFNKTIQNHTLKGFAFSEIRYADRTINPFQGYGIQYDRGNQVFTNPLVFQKLLNQGSNYFSLSENYDRGVTFSLNGTYGYKGKYLLNTVVNYEGSNASGKKSRSRWLPTWNIGGKWNIDKEDFFTLKNVSNLSFRVSYGLTAKMNEQAINSNTVFKNSIINRLKFEDKENAIRILHLENRDLTWEKMYEFNLGIDAGFYNGKIKTTVDLYQRNSFDLIDLVRTSGVGGKYYKYANFGDMKTKGIELGMYTKNISTDDFSWKSNITFSYMHQRITRLLNTPNTFDLVSGTGKGNIVGYPKGSLFSFNFQGLNNLGLPTFDFGLYPLNNQINSKITGANFADSQFSKSYLIYHGSIQPNVFGGISNTFNYKNWELSFFITAQGGNKIRLNPTFDPSFLDLNVFSKAYQDRWLNPMDELYTDIPTIPSQNLIQLLGNQNIEKAYNTYNYSQVRVVDGSFVRMKNISLGYKVSELALKRYNLSSLALRLQLTNPFLIYSDKRLRGQDPEYYKSGGVSLPTPKQFTLSLNIGI